MPIFPRLATARPPRRQRREAAAFVKAATVRSFLAAHPEWRERVRLSADGHHVQADDAESLAALKAFATE